ncbi:MAG: hypothetical protein CM15mP106_1300 [Candidatus Neomarinimicrobiota bacterium]|nr:MAG: hypothetical protein CM15mP106_1300 [Candidatus Neomarinimicrobiota bacterium]
MGDDNIEGEINFLFGIRIIRAPRVNKKPRKGSATGGMGMTHLSILQGGGFQLQ